MADVKAFFTSLLRSADTSRSTRPTYNESIRRCRKELNASEAQMREAWRIVSPEFGIRRGRRRKRVMNTDGNADGNFGRQ